MTGVTGVRESPNGYGLYDPESRMEKLSKGPWWCRACNTVATRVVHARGETPPCPVCDSRAYMDEQIAAGVPWYRIRKRRRG